MSIIAQELDERLRTLDPRRQDVYFLAPSQGQSGMSLSRRKKTSSTV